MTEDPAKAERICGKLGGYQQLGCSDELWLELVRHREQEHPEDALPIYQRRIEAAIGQGNESGYQDAVKRLGALRDILGRLGRTRDFTEYLNGLRVAHKRKRNFQKLLQAAEWG